MVGRRYYNYSRPRNWQSNFEDRKNWLISQVLRWCNISGLGRGESRPARLNLKTMKKNLFKFIFTSTRRTLMFVVATLMLLGARVYLYFYARQAAEVSIWRLVWVELVALFLFLLIFVIIYGAYVRSYGIPQRKWTQQPGTFSGPSVFWLAP